MSIAHNRRTSRVHDISDPTGTAPLDPAPEHGAILTPVAITLCHLGDGLLISQGVKQHDRRSIAAQHPQEQRAVGRCRAALRRAGRGRGAGRPARSSVLARGGGARGPTARKHGRGPQRLQGRALRGAARRRPSMAAGSAPSRLAGDARCDRLRAERTAALPGRRRPGARNARLTALRRGLPHAQRLGPPNRRRQAAGDGVDPRRRLHLRIRLDAQLLR